MTGASRGLGKAIVDALSSSDWIVVAICRPPLRPSVWKSAEDVQTVVHDVRSDDTDALMAVIGQRPVDLLINNAAQGAKYQPLGSVAMAGILDAVDVNAAGPLRLVQALLPNLLRASDPLIINITSRLGSLSAQARGDFSDLSTSYAYKISKAAQNMLSVALAQDLQVAHSLGW